MSVTSNEFPQKHPTKRKYFVLPLLWYYLSKKDHNLYSIGIHNINNTSKHHQILFYYSFFNVFLFFSFIGYKSDSRFLLWAKRWNNRFSLCFAVLSIMINILLIFECDKLVLVMTKADCKRLKAERVVYLTIMAPSASSYLQSAFSLR